MKYNNIKKRLASIVCLLLLLSLNVHSQTKKSFVVEGTIENSNNLKVKLSLADIGNYEELDSTSINMGKFILKGSISESQVLYLNIGEGQGIPVFIDTAISHYEFSLVENSNNQYEILENTDSKSQLLLDLLNSPGKYLRNWTYNLEQIKMVEDEKSRQLLVEKIKNNKERFLATSEANSQFYQSVPGLFVFYQAYKYLPFKEKGIILKKFSAEVQSSVYYRVMEEDYTRRLRLQPGSEAPSFTLLDTVGNRQELSQFLGTPVLLYFGASWCYWCKKEEPNILKAKEKYDDQLSVVYISLDTKKEDWKQDVINKPENWNSLSDLKGWNSKVAKDYYIQGVPRIMLIDENGLILGDELRGEAVLIALENYYKSRSLE